LHPKDIQELLKESLPVAEDRTSSQWVQWATQRAVRIELMLEGTHATDKAALVAMRRWKNLLRAMERIARIDPSLLLASNEDHGAVRFDVVWAADYAESWLFRHVPRVYLTSATFTRHSADLLGIAPNDLRMHESGSSFPLARRPVYFLTSPTVPRVDHRMTPQAETRWLIEIDRIIGSRLDRKGILHCKSYKRRDLLMARSEHRERMVTHGRFDAAERIAAFRQMKPGHILVSPSVTTGYDFPYAHAEYQIICKVPFQDSRDPVTKARTQIDKRYPAYQAMQEIIQAVGRGMRAVDDQCETFLVDAHFGWFLNKNGDLMPKWFRSAIVRANALPSPPPALGHVIRS
jgi:Rad3-related DNA helicase